MRKYCLTLFFLIAILSFSNIADDAGRTLEIQQRQIEQDRIREEQQRKRSELESTKFDNIRKIETQNNKNVDDFPKFYITKINIIDYEKLLSGSDKRKFLDKYEFSRMNGADIQQLLTDITNKLISKGYITSSAALSENNDLSTGFLNIEIMAGKIGEIRINSGTFSDRYKEFFMFKNNEEKVLNMRDLDTATDNFNSISANNMTMEIVPGERENYSKVVVKNELKNKYTLTLLGNNFGENSQNGMWRYGVGFNIDSPFGIGDNFRFTYMTVDKKKVDRSWKKTVDELKPGEILPIGPTGYDPAAGDTLPYKRRLDMFTLAYTMKFRDYTLRLNSSKSIQESSFYASNTVYDMYSLSHTLSAGLEKIIFRNQKSRVSLDIGVRRKKNESYLEKGMLTDRRLTIGNIGLNVSASVFGGILGTAMGYERGLRIFHAERDDGKLPAGPGAQFDKYTLDIGYYRPIAGRFVYRLNINGSYSDDVLYGSERQTVGGVGSVGGYKNDIIQGDKALEISNEIAYSIPIKKLAVISPYVSYGYGVSKYNRDNSKYRTGYMTGLTTGIRLDSKYPDLDFGYAKAMKHSEYLKPRSQDIYLSETVKVSF